MSIFDSQQVKAFERVFACNFVCDVGDVAVFYVENAEKNNFVGVSDIQSNYYGIVRDEDAKSEEDGQLKVIDAKGLVQ